MVVVVVLTINGVNSLLNKKHRVNSGLVPPPYNLGKKCREFYNLVEKEQIVKN